MHYYQLLFWNVQYTNHSARQLFLHCTAAYFAQTRTNNIVAFGPHYLCSDMQNIGTIGWENIFRMRKDKDWNTFEFMETISLNSINYHLLHEDCGNTLINVAERSKSAWFLVISSILLQKIQPFAKFCMLCVKHVFFIQGKMNKLGHFLPHILMQTLYLTYWLV